uniref:Protein HGH1 homolog n=1 Tax=Alexandrium catenella TaxID=2925 RepID=A0A7S1PVT5_ALECA|mmetsp:Transcript_114029/g.303109  ORF Transcript_114029/g.303109 Transcript_114029/m.303109 type:complete len:241 (+) Transcript_114029:52-774(+)
MAGGAHRSSGERVDDEDGAEFIEDDDEEEDDDPVKDVQRLVEDMQPGCDDRAKEEAMHMLKELYLKFKCGYGITCAILKAGAMTPLVALVASGTDQQKEQAAELISTLAYTSRFGLVSDSGLKNEVRILGGYASLAALLRDGRGKQQEHSGAALENLAVTPRDRDEIAQACGGCTELVRLVQEGSLAQKELAFRLLRAMLVDGHQDAVAKAAGVVTSYTAQVEARSAEGQVDGTPEVTVC